VRAERHSTRTWQPREYASSGIGTPPHLAGELFKSMAGVDIVHVPYREANSGLNAVVSGAVQMMFSIASTAQSQIAGCPS
jgi:tripartite-type tricarboxylate transporter receptor subunit TctC